MTTATISPASRGFYRYGLRTGTFYRLQRWGYREHWARRLRP
jgi:hypothetical protein